MTATGGGGDLEVAVIGMDCRFPGAQGVEAFWENLRNGVESTSFFTDEELRESGVDPQTIQHPGYVRAAAVLDDVDRFDARFFGFTPREAQALDPQHRLFLESAWTALERAGYDPSRYRGNIGVYAGSSLSAHYLRLLANPQLREAISGMQAHISTDKDFLATRVAYKLDLVGPAVTVQTACSTSLVAVHLACQALLTGDCDMALAGGVSADAPQKVGYVYEPDGIASQDGHCRAFDSLATGTVRGSGLGIVVLKRLGDALRDGDQVEAVLKGWAMNNDGSNRVGFTAPGVEGQTRVVRMAQAMAGVEPESIGYIEAHGTGTALGDPIEITALTRVMGAAATGKRFCAIGSVKTNIGHLDAAAGIAGLIKTVLMLKHRQLVPSLHFRTPNPRIDFENSPFYVSTQTAEWVGNGGPRRAGVSSFGIGGTNVHIVLEEPPRRLPEAAAAGPEVLVLSARTETALEQATDALAAHLRAHPSLPLGDVAFTLGAGRRPFGHRRAVVCRDLDEGARALAGRDPRQVWSAVADEGRPAAFLFSGQGAQHVNMARGLYEAEPEFRAEVDACCELLRPLLGLDLRRLMFPPAGEVTAAAERLNETRITQPALFTIEYALARLWMSWGVSPNSMIGHSVGEYVAACLAGVLGRDEALAVVAERARLMQDCPRGAMTVVALTSEAVRPYLTGRLDLCVVNGPEACVVGGPIEEVERLETRLRGEGVIFGRVPTSHAFHSALMEPALAPFMERLAQVRLQPPRIPFVSNLTGTWITAEQATDPRYWVRQLREPVRFSEGLETLIEKPQWALLEVGPAHTLVALAKRRFPAGSPRLALASLPHPRQAEPDETYFLQTAARLWASGVAIDWSLRKRARRVRLPTYPFERERYGIDQGQPTEGVRPSPARKLPVERWLYAPSWRRSETVAASPEASRGSWCVFADGGGIGEALAARLREGGTTVTVVKPGSGFAWRETDACVVEPTQRADYERLLDELDSRGGAPNRFVHLWGVGGGVGESIDYLLSVLRLGDALGRRGSRETSLVVVSSGTQEVLGDEPLSPLRAAALGPCRVLSQEYPLLTCRTVDVPAPGGSATAALVEQVRAEITSGSAEPAVAYRGRYRWVQSFDPIAPAAGAPDTARLRHRGVYFLTGGLGRIGLALAAYLAQTVQARLVLSSRSGLPDRKEWDALLAGAPADDVVTGRIRAVRELETLGAEVLVVRADVADGDQMRTAVALTRERFGRMDGLIHAAGELGPTVVRPLAETERGDCERQLRPKLGGAEVIDGVLGDESCDFVLVTSSLSTVLGGLGFAAYSAVNCALDAFARRQHQRGKGFWMSACWDAWRFHADFPEGDRLAALAIAPREGGETLGRLLALPPQPQIVVSTTPLQERLDRWTKPATAERPKDETLAGALERHPRPEMSAVYIAPEDPVERRLASLWGELLGIDRVGLDDNFFELGGSSLLAVHLMGRLRKEYPVELSVAMLFEASTVRTLSRVIRSHQGPDPGLARSADRGQARKGTRKRQRRTSDAAVE